MGVFQKRHFVQSHLTTLTFIINNAELLRGLCLEKRIITLEEYNATNSHVLSSQQGGKEKRIFLNGKKFEA